MCVPKILSTSEVKALCFAFNLLLWVTLLSPIASASEDFLSKESQKQADQLAKTGAINYETHIAPIIDKYCTSCHNPDDDEGNIDLEALLTTKSANIRERTLLLGWAFQVGYYGIRG